MSSDHGVGANEVDRDMSVRVEGVACVSLLPGQSALLSLAGRVGERWMAWFAWRREDLDTEF
jgi:hypothetical protein